MKKWYIGLEASDIVSHVKNMALSVIQSKQEQDYDYFIEQWQEVRNCLIEHRTPYHIHNPRIWEEWTDVLKAIDKAKWIMCEYMDRYWSRGLDKMCECDNQESRFFQNHGECEYCFYGIGECE